MAIRRTDEEVVEEFNQVWGEGRWDYSEVEYLNNITKVSIKCPRHRTRFEQLPNNHRKGQVGCSECREGMTTSKWIQLVREEVSREWDYSKAEYVNAQTPVTIICPEHGEFSQLPWNHRRGHVGCNECSGHRVDTDMFKQRVRDQYGDRWELSKTVYTSSKGEVTITCREHGDFTQVAEVHAKGHIGCRSCQPFKVSASELDILKTVRDMGFEAEHGSRKILKSGREIDVYVPSKRVGIEFNGLYYHSEKFRSPNSHLSKYQETAQQGIRLLQIWEDDWLNKREIVEEHLRQVLGVSTLSKISARNTEVVEVSRQRASEFMNRYHIQGFRGASVHYGLENEGDLVAVASLKYREGGDLELVRYATSANVRGGHSKLVAHVERNQSYPRLVTFADLTFSDGALYRATGWTEDGWLRPDYFYMRGVTRYHKFNFRIKRFRDDPTLKYEEGMTERQLAQLNGLLRVYDAGKIRFTKPHPDLV